MTKRLKFRIIVIFFCALVAITGYSQQKPAAQKPKKETPPPPPPRGTAKEEAPVAEMPPLPDIDTTAAPDDELTKEIKMMIKQMGSLEVAENTVRSLMEAQKQNPNPKIPPEFYDRFLGLIGTGRMRNLMEIIFVKVYREKFTLAEMKELNAFYVTPLGKKIITELPDIYQKSHDEGEKLGQFLGMEIIVNMMKEGKWK